MIRGIVGYIGLGIIVAVAVHQYNPGLFTKRDAVLLGLIWPITLFFWIVIGVATELGPDRED